jgi:PAS domain S-box-containing protein
MEEPPTIEQQIQLTLLSMERSRDAVYWMGSDARLVYVNDAACKALGYSREELLELKVHDIDPEFSPDVWPAHWEDLRERGSFLLESTHRTRAGETFPVELLVNFVTLGDQELNCALARDITERKRAEQALISGSRLEAAATLAGGLAHDINNLMVGVLGSAELLRDELGHRPNLLELADAVAEAAKEASILTQQLLAFARGGRYEPRPTDLNEVINETLHLQRRAFPPRVAIDRDLAPGIWSALIDAVQLKQVLMNVCINSVEAIGGHGRLTICTRNIEVTEAETCAGQALPLGRYVQLETTDSGCGMDERTRTRAFEPFFTTKFQGRGLGLAAVYGIVANHGGQVTIRSAPGQGTVVSITLPVCAAESAEAAEEQRPRDGALSGSETVLLIDDEETVVNVGCRMLERLGYSVVVARTGSEGVELAQAHPGAIDLALLDMGMPVMGGREAYPLLIKARPKMKVLICSGYELDTAAQEVLDAGAQGFIHKPFRFSELAAALRAILDQPGDEPD